MNDKNYYTFNTHISEKQFEKIILIIPFTSYFESRQPNIKNNILM